MMDVGVINQAQVPSEPATADWDAFDKARTGMLLLFLDLARRFPKSPLVKGEIESTSHAMLTIVDLCESRHAG